MTSPSTQQTSEQRAADQRSPERRRPRTGAQVPDDEWGDGEGARDAEGMADRLAYAATHDDLTGLPNRTLLRQRLDEALDRHRRLAEAVAVIFFDLDHFKKVNDSLGHRAGDELLVEASGRIEATVRPTDLVARFGGDEFVVVCQGLIGEIEALGIADRIREALERPFTISGQAVYVSASLGVAWPRPDSADADSLLSDADAAMFVAKQGGRGRTEAYDRRLRDRARERLANEAALRTALEADELRLAFQPVVELDTGRVAGVEALIRWDHPERGALRPDAFMVLAEETGLISQVGAWAVREACRHQAKWDALGADAAQPIWTAVNVSAYQLSRPELAQALEEALAENGVDPSHIRLEITETAVVENPTSGVAALRALKAHGVTLVLDDFGTGYASLSALRRFPLDCIKVDRSFVDGLTTNRADRAIVAAVIRLGAEMGLEVVAEGVESEDQRDVLMEQGCRLGQGYHFSRPLSPGEVRSLLLGAVAGAGGRVGALR
jgi:diguanylate cyclase (GGDEF)-like protein